MKNAKTKISEIRISKELLVISWRATMATAYDVMQANGTRHLPVTDDQSFIVGMISDRDAKKAMIFDQADWLSAKTPQPEFDPNSLVRDYMSWPAVTIHETSSLKEAAQSMLTNKISALVVLRGEIALGIITTDDLLKAIVQEEEDEVSGFQNTIAAAVYKSPLGSIVQTLAGSGI